MRAKAPTDRLLQLDALRGIAALVVVFTHWALTAHAFSAPGLTASPLSALAHTPLRILVAGPEAVVLFFVLSGLVLALPILGGTQPAFGAYLVKRACRLYPVAWAAGGVSLVLAVVVGPSRGDETQWAASQWPGMPGLDAIADHFALIVPSGPLGQFDAPLWSLTHELRVSLIFPLLAAVVLSSRPGRPTMTAAALTVVASMTMPTLGTSFVMTLAYLTPFVAGIEIARHREAVVRALERWSGRATAGAVLATLAVMPLASEVTGRPALIVRELGLHILLPTGCAALLVCVALTPRVASWLTNRVTRFLGDVSYSLYLVHVPILLVLLRATGGTSVPLAVVGIGASLLVAYACHRLIERPGIALGKRLAQRSGRPRTIPAPEAA